MKMRSAFLTTIVAGFLLSSTCGVQAQNDILLDPVAVEGEETPMILEPQPEPAVEIPPRWW